MDKGSANFSAHGLEVQIMKTSSTLPLLNISLSEPEKYISQSYIRNDVHVERNVVDGSVRLS